MDIPAFKTNEASPNVNFGQIRDLYLAQLGNPLADLLQDTLDGRIDNDGVVGTEIRQIPVIAEKPQPEANEIDISHGRTFKAPRKHVINFKIDETDDENYSFMKNIIENNVTTVLAWYRTKSKFYGGTAGVEASIKLDHIIPESDEELETIVGSLEWETSVYPERTDYPLASA